MRFIPKFIKKLIKMLCAGAFTIIVAACYGIYMDYRDSLNFLFHVKNPDGEPIPGLQVELLESGNLFRTTWTDEFGDAFLNTYSDYYWGGSEYTVVIEDIDGPDNLGEFETVIMDVSGSVGSTEEYYVTMYPVK